MKKIFAIIISITLMTSVLIGCGGSSSDNGTDKAGNKGTVKLGYVNWAEGIAMTNLAAAILEDKMGYEVDLTMGDVAPIFTSVASGNTDAFLDVWMPVTHNDYMEKYGKDLVDLGVVFENALIGLVVPSYVEVDSIDELKDNKELFGGQIIGIDSGAGIMLATERAIQEYELEYQLVSGSGPTMTAALKKAIDAGDPIIVTGWKPHWKFARWDLKVLEDPKNVYGDSEEIRIVTRKGLAEDMPEVNTFLTNFKMSDTELGDLMGAIEDSQEDPLEAAREWMINNTELVDSWIG